MAGMAGFTAVTIKIRIEIHIKSGIVISELLIQLTVGNPGLKVCSVCEGTASCYHFEIII